MSNYIENNKNTWFTLNEEKQPDEMMNTKKYMMTIRNAFKRHMEQQEENA